MTAFLDKSFFDAGGRETVSVFRVNCTRCGREERTGTHLPSHFDAETSGGAKRLRMSCKEQAPLPCRFGNACKVEQLDHPGAMSLHLVWEEEMGAPPAPFDLADLPVLAEASYAALQPPGKGE